ncbi:MAG TPA: hypothetical protein VKT75_10620 [Acidobacteriaceae bacterium]|nr:hypothetical protein [Acidobacteriaceae bacterium]
MDGLMRQKLKLTLGITLLAFGIGALVTGFETGCRSHHEVTFHQPHTAAHTITLSSTTLTYALKGPPTWPSTVFLGSLAGITPPGDPTSTSGIGTPGGAPSFTLLMIDQEVMQVFSLNASSKSVLVNRGYLGTAAAAHNAGAIVYFGPPEYFSWN